MKAFGVREPSRFASLSSGLLARKGQASPAMRRQDAETFHSGEDLGWNDMGAVHPAAVIVPVPEVLRQQAELAATIAAPSAIDPDPIVLSEAVAKKSKAAFTLRLDAERHLRLRLACAVRRRSAQAIVTHALDVYLETLPEIDALAGQVNGPALPSR